MTLTVYMIILQMTLTVYMIILQSCSLYEYFTDDLDSFLHDSEKHKITLHELQLIRALDDDKTVPGFPKVKLYRGQAIGSVLCNPQIGQTLQGSINVAYRQNNTKYFSFIY